MKTLVNIGCGNRFHPDWVNIDLRPSSASVISHDVASGIPFPDRHADAVYHSHLIEHLPRKQASKLVAECFRVLRPGGVLRVATPDLETICRTYLERLEALLSGDTGAENDYEWLLLELYDQASRDQSGGEMAAFLLQEPIPNEDFVYSRIGVAGRRIVESLRAQKRLAQHEGSDEIVKERYLSRTWLRKLLDQTRGLLLTALGVVETRDQRALDIGRFRLSGEVHYWMYDRYSLERLMIHAGFKSPIQQKANSSLIERWNDYHLDTDPDGSVYKPDSFFMEAVRPE